MLSPGAGQFLGFMQQAFVQATSDNNLRPGAAPRKGKPAGRSGRRLACRGGRHLAARKRRAHNKNLRFKLCLREVPGGGTPPSTARETRATTVAAGVSPASRLPWRAASCRPADTPAAQTAGVSAGQVAQLYAWRDAAATFLWSGHWERGFERILACRV
jgi:hypothetical protein